MTPALKEEIRSHLILHGREAATLLGMREGFSHLRHNNSILSYWESGSFWISLGAPAAPTADLKKDVVFFNASALQQKRKLIFTAIESTDWLPTGYQLVKIGELPIWEPSLWQNAVTSSANLREQLRRARAKNIELRYFDQAARFADDTVWSEPFFSVAHSWFASRNLPPLSFALTPQKKIAVGQQAIVAAYRAGELIAFCRLIPAYESRGWLIENVFRTRRAPNGTTELLFDHVIKTAEEQRKEMVTLGMVPLYDSDSLTLKIVKRSFSHFYNFEGLLQFRKKLEPNSWKPIYMAFPKEISQLRAMIAHCYVLMDGKPLEFLWRSFRERFE